MSLTSRSQNNPKYNPNFFNACKKASKNKKLKNMELYFKNPKICSSCLMVIPYEKRCNQYCDHSCAAKSTNKVRKTTLSECRDFFLNETISFLKTRHYSHTNFKKGQKRNRKTGKIENVIKYDPKKWIDYTPVFCCYVCNNFFMGNKKKYCIKCNLNDVKIYRNSCKFNLNPKTHYELYDFQLIKQYAWYSPSNSKNPNLNGVTWDHLYKISDGFLNKVDPKIMSHPANAEMVLMSENQQRHIKGSSISFEELIKRIDLWNQLH